MIRRAGTSVLVEASRARQLRRCRPRTSCSWFRPVSPSSFSTNSTTTQLLQRQLWTTTTSASAANLSVDQVHNQSPLASAISGLLFLGGALMLSSIPDKTLTEGTQTTESNDPSSSSSPSSEEEPPPKPIPFEKFVTKGQWTKDGLLYDHPEDDEETHCSFCRLYRQGPCRPYWRPLELCLNYRDEETGEKYDCREWSNRFIMDCLSDYGALYTLIELQEWQDEVIDETDLHERQSAYQDIWALSNTTKNQQLPSSSTTTLEPPETVPERVQKILANDRLYQHMLDNVAWNQAIEIDWRRWAKYVHIMKWKRDDLQLMIESEANFIKQQPPTRPVWWSTAPSLGTEGMEQIVEFITHYHDDTEQQQSQSQSQSQQSPVPWPLQQRPNDEDHDGPLIRNTASTLFSNNKEKKPLEGEAYWHNLPGNPMLIPIPVFFPKKHPRQNQCELLYAYGRDADTGMLLGYYFAPDKKQDDASSDETSNSTSSSDHQEQEQEKESNEQEDDSSQAAATNANPKEDESSVTMMLVHLLPGRTSSIQLFAAYATEDSYSLMETAPISVIDSILAPSELNPDDVEDVVVHDSPQGLNEEDLRERWERYQILHNFCKFQLTATMATSAAADASSSVAATKPQG